MEYFTVLRGRRVVGSCSSQKSIRRPRAVPWDILWLRSFRGPTKVTPSEADPEEVIETPRRAAARDEGKRHRSETNASLV